MSSRPQDLWSRNQCTDCASTWGGWHSSGYGLQDQWFMPTEARATPDLLSAASAQGLQGSESQPCGGMTSPRLDGGAGATKHMPRCTDKPGVPAGAVTFSGAHLLMMASTSTWMGLLSVSR